MLKNNSIPGLDFKADLYFHIPFCVKKCGYCYFYSLENRSVDVMNEYLDFLEKEIVLKKKKWKLPKQIRAIYIGGGTPSCLPLATLKKLFVILHGHFDIGQVEEFTMEINPSFCDEQKLDLLKKNGVTRLSFGIQTVDRKILRKIKRVFDAQNVERMIGHAQRLGFKTINLDFMFRLPDQDKMSLLEDFEFIKKINPSSVYWYETKNVTDHMKSVNSDKEKFSNFDSLICEEMKRLGYRRTMTEFFSKDSRPCQYTFDFLLADYVIGFGPFSISKHKDTFFKNVVDIEKYQDFLRSGKLPVSGSFKLNKGEAAASFLSYWLRFGFADLKFVGDKFKVNLEKELGREIGLLKKYGLLQQEGSGLILTDSGFSKTPDVQIVLLRKHENFLKNLNAFLGRGYRLK